MAICAITRMACNCQPDEGVPCDGLATLQRGFHEWRDAALKAQKENRDLRARCEQFRWHLQWIFNPAGNDICTPKEIAEMALKRTRPKFFKRTNAQPPTPSDKP